MTTYQERRPQRETPKAAAAYAAYAALGLERSLTRLAEQFWQESGGKGTKESAVRTIRKQLGLWSAQHKWQERIKEYDRQQIEKKRRQREAELEKLNEEQAKYGRAMSGLAMKHIQELITKGNFNAQSAVMLFKYATDLERESRGAAARLEIELGGMPNGEPIKTEQTSNILIYLPRKDEIPTRQIEGPTL